MAQRLRDDAQRQFAAGQNNVPVMYQPQNHPPYQPQPGGPSFSPPSSIPAVHHPHQQQHQSSFAAGAVHYNNHPDAYPQQRQPQAFSQQQQMYHHHPPPQQQQPPLEVNPFASSTTRLPRQPQQQQQQLHELHEQQQNPFQPQQSSSHLPPPPLHQPPPTPPLHRPGMMMPSTMSQHHHQEPPFFQHQHQNNNGTGPTTTSTTTAAAVRPVDVRRVRDDWRKHGVNLSQALEDVRNNMGTSSSTPRHNNPGQLRVRVVGSVARKDAVDQPYTAYVIELSSSSNVPPPGSNGVVYIERRFNDFLKFKEQSQVQVTAAVPFPAKNTIFYKSRETVIADRIKQLDAWLVHAVVLYNNGQIVDEMGFLRPCPLPHPFQRFESDNDIMALQPAVHILRGTTGVPNDLWRTAVGLIIYTSKSMLPVPSLAGLLIARRPNNSWSAPIAIQSVGISTASVVMVTRESVLRDICTGTRLDLGATQDVLVPVLEPESSSSPHHNKNKNTAAYATAVTSFASVLSTVRTSVNAKFYGKAVDALQDLLPTDGPTHIPAAQALYEALQQMRLY